jgi:hypothetical protein
VTRRLLLVCGILSSLLYAGMNVFIPALWPDYSSAAQTVSELSAIGAPTRSIWVAFGLVYTLLVAAFGWGVLASGRSNRPLCISGGLIITYGVVSLFWPLAPMHLRGGPFALTDAMHIALTMTTVLLMLLSMGFGAAALGKGFLRYSVATMVILVAFGGLTSLDAPGVAANLPTPRIGIWERINIGVFLLWVAVLAVMLWRDPADRR